MQENNIRNFDETFSELDNTTSFHEDPWLVDPEIIYYPEKLQFDLSLNVAKYILSMLPHEGNRLEEVCDEQGKFLNYKFIHGMDDEAADFYVRTMSSNLRRYFDSKVPASYAGERLGVDASPILTI